MWADGGNEGQYAGCGGGGRIAVYYGSVSNFSLANIHCRGGPNGGGAGTIVLHDRAQPLPGLFLDNDGRGTGAGSTDIAIGTGRIGAIGVYDDANLWLTLTNETTVGWAVCSSAVFTVTGDLRATGDVRFLGTGIIRHPAGQASGLHIKADGRFVVGPNGRVDVNGLGGQAAGVTGRSGASHGGWGEGAVGDTNPLFGDWLWPRSLGVGGAGDDWGNSRGGGAMWIEAGEMVLDGRLAASGSSDVYRTGGASGGSILVEAGRLTGAGTMWADGGNEGQYAGCGGGGRIAV
jgi:hypothetical protein